MRSATLSLAALVAVLHASPVIAQENARTIVEKAIAAHGGEANVAKLRSMRVKVEGTAAFIPGKPNSPVVLEDVWRMPHQYKSSLTIEVMGRRLTQVQAIDENGGWIQVNGQTQDLPQPAADEMREQKRGEDLDRLAFLEEEGIELSALQATSIADQPAVGVLVKAPGHRDVKLYFSKSTGLLIEREHQVLDPGSGRMVVQEVRFGDYEEQDGVKHYRRIVAYRDGDKTFDGTVTEIEFLKQVDPTVFEKPKP